MGQDLTQPIRKKVPSPKRKGAKTRIARRKRELFLIQLARTGNVAESAKLVGYASSVALQKVRKQDPDFAAAWEEAEQAFVDKAEAELVRRAVEGIEKGVYYKGERCDTEKQYSDGLLQFYLKSKRPEIYGDSKRVDVNVGGEVGVAVIPMAMDSEKAWEEEAATIHDQHRKYLEKKEEKVIDADFEEVVPTKTKRA